MNCELAVAKELFETTSLVVYTVGSLDKKAPALTAQARPQDGECFGEFPPRRIMDSVTAFPVIIPSSTPGYNSAYTATFLKEYGGTAVEQWGLPDGLAACRALAQQCRSPEQKGYCRVLLDYLVDA